MNANWKASGLGRRPRSSIFSQCASGCAIVVRFGLAFGGAFCLALLSSAPRPALSARALPPEPFADPRRETPDTPAETTCPSEIAALGEALLADFPGYYNRAQIRSRIPGRPASLARVQLASGLEVLTSEELAEFEDATIEGFFFSTLERTYINDEFLTRQGFHQLFLTRDAAGWIFLTARSSWGDYPDAEPVSPPITSSTGLVAQAARTWLRDCQAP